MSPESLSTCTLRTAVPRRSTSPEPASTVTRTPGGTAMRRSAYALQDDPLGRLQLLSSVSTPFLRVCSSSGWDTTQCRVSRTWMSLDAGNEVDVAAVGLDDDLADRAVDGVGLDLRLVEGEVRGGPDAAR